jgi:rhamnosyltransferase subunit B
MSDLEFILCTMGTRGDFLPFLAIAKGLLKRGLGVTLLSNSNWRDEAIAAGVQFHSIAEKDPPQSGRDDYRFFATNVLEAFKNSYAFVEGRALEGRRCVAIYQLNMLGLECAAQKFDLPNIKVGLQPCVVKSFMRPPWPLTALVEGRMGKAARYGLVPLIYGFSDLVTPYRRHANAFRRSVGVRPIPFASRYHGSEDLMLIMCPEWFAMPQSDWPSNCRVVGFPFCDDPVADPEVDAFIRERGAPIIYTPGTGVTDVLDFFDRARAAHDRLRLPSVLLSPNAVGLRASQDDMLVKSYVDLSWLLPRSRLLVHHGGIGSMAQALRAGIPQIVFPDRFDQPDNAYRIAALGLGGTVFARRCACSDFVDLAARVLGNDGMRHRLAQAARMIKQQDAIGDTLHHIDLAARRVLDRHGKRRDGAIAQAGCLR